MVTVMKLLTENRSDPCIHMGHRSNLAKKEVQNTVLLENIT